MDSRNLIDPDGGINIEDERLKFGSEEEKITTLANFPTKGFAAGINSKMNVGYSQIWKFLIEAITKITSVQL